MQKSLVILVFLVNAALAAADWDQVLKHGWTPPTESFLYGYSEFTPSYLGGVRPYETFLDRPATLTQNHAFREFVITSNPEHSFGIRRYEELRHIQPGLRHLTGHWIKDLKQLVAGETPGGSKLKGIPKLVVDGNPFWPQALANKASSKKIVSITPIALSRINKDLGQVHPWTIYGGAELPWEKLFWVHSFEANTRATPFWCNLLEKAFDETGNCDLKKWGVGIFTEHPEWIPSEMAPLITPTSSRRKIRYLITFEPHSKWSETWKNLYADKQLEVIPHPSTLLFSGSPFFANLAAQTKSKEPLQIPLAIELSQYSEGLSNGGFFGMGILDVSRKTHRFQRARDRVRNENRGMGIDLNDPVAPLFSADPAILGVYGKPIARNTQLWGVSGALKGKWLLDGPSADRLEIERVVALIESDRTAERSSQLHYRNYYPPMDINGYATTWYRPIVAWNTNSGEKFEMDTSLMGSTRLVRPDGQEAWFPVTLTDGISDRDLATIQDIEGEEANPETTSMNVQKLLEFAALLEKKLPVDLASALINPVKANQDSYIKWRDESNLPATLRKRLDQSIDSKATSNLSEPLTFSNTVNSEFEWEYWKHIVALSEGPTRINKNNTDCAATDDDETPRRPGPSGMPNKKRDEHCDRNHLPDVLDHLERYYRNELGINEIYYQTFDWKTDFDFAWDGLKKKQRNMIVVIHGTDNHRHNEAIIMGDHYDTAPMGDIYEGESYAEKKKVPELTGHRHASKGSDDNYSATATLMQAAKVLKSMKLERDVWLVHITGEEFPADGLGSRALIEALVENQPLVPGGNPKIAGVYILDMVAHSTDRDHTTKEPAPAIFQISPGRGERSAALAVIAHEATRNWNKKRVSENWDAKFQRTKYWKRYTPPTNLPPEKFPLPKLGKFLEMQGEIRPGWHFRSSLYNTDIQLFSDAGFPSVLFMENYDINREGYHDTQDNLTNIDLDFGRGVLSIAIETVAQAATRK